MPGRSFSSPSYRYGFNGKEKDDEVDGSGNQYNYGFRIYNPRLGKFLSVDPLQKKYASWTPYAFAMNNAVAGVDLDGREFLEYLYAKIKEYYGDEVIKTTWAGQILTGTYKNFTAAGMVEGQLDNLKARYQAIKTGDKNAVAKEMFAFAYPVLSFQQDMTLSTVNNIKAAARGNGEAQVNLLALGAAFYVGFKGVAAEGSMPIEEPVLADVEPVVMEEPKSNVTGIQGISEFKGGYAARSFAEITENATNITAASAKETNLLVNGSAQQAWGELMNKYGKTVDQLTPTKTGGYTFKTGNTSYTLYNQKSTGGFVDLTIQETTASGTTKARFTLE